MITIWFNLGSWCVQINSLFMWKVGFCASFPSILIYLSSIPPYSKNNETPYSTVKSWYSSIRYNFQCIDHCDLIFDGWGLLYIGKDVCLLHVLLYWPSEVYVHYCSSLNHMLSYIGRQKVYVHCCGWCSVRVLKLSILFVMIIVVI